MHYRFDNFVLHPGARLLRRDQVELDVPRKVFDCLAYLIEHRDRAIARDELIDVVWKRSNVSDNQLAHAIADLRRLLLDDGASQRLIRTVPGFGYHWTGSVDAVEDPGEQATRSDSGAVESIALAQPGSASAPAVESAAVAIPVAASAAAPDPTAAPRSAMHQLWAWSIVAILAALAVFAAWWRTHPTVATTTPDSVVETDSMQSWVLPAVLLDDSEGWARIGLMALVAEGLHRQGAQVVPIQKALTRIAEVPANADLAKLAQELDAALVVAPRAYRVQQSWVVALAAQARVGGSIRVDGSAQDLLAAGRMAVRRLNERLKRSGPNLDGSIEETFELIRQAIRARDYEGALLQLSRLSDADRQRSEAGFLEIELELERGRNSVAKKKADLWLERLDSATQPAAYARLLLSKARAMRQLNEPDWPNLVDQAIARLQGADSPHDLAVAKQLRGIAAFLDGRKTDAVRDLMDAREMFSQLGDELRVARVTSTMGQLAVLDGRLGEASLQLTQSAAVLEAYGAIGVLRSNMMWTAYLQSYRLRWQDVLRTTDRMRALQQKAGKTSSYEDATYLRIRTRALMKLGRLNEAQALLDEQERAVRHDIQDNDMGPGGVEDLLDIASQRAQLQIAQGHWDSAVNTATAGLAMLPESGSVKHHRIDAEALLRLLIDAHAGTRSWCAAGPMPTLTSAQLEILKAATTIDGHVAQACWNAGRGLPDAAEADYRAALALARARPQDAAGMLEATTAYVDFQLARHRVRDAAQMLDALLANWPELPEHSYAAALLVLKVRSAQDDHDGTQAAARQVLTLAGERQPPRELVPAFEESRMPGSPARP